MKRVKDHMEYVKDNSGRIVLDSRKKYNDHMRIHNDQIEERKKVGDLEKEVKELKEMLSKLISLQTIPEAKTTSKSSTKKSS